MALLAVDMGLKTGLVMFGSTSSLCANRARGISTTRHSTSSTGRESMENKAVL